MTTETTETRDTHVIPPEAQGAERAVAAMEEPIRAARADDARYHHLPFLRPIALGDVAQLTRKDREYGGSWKKRGGVGAFMMMARKWDRLEHQVDEMRSYSAPRGNSLPAEKTGFMAGPYDIFGHITGGELEAGLGEKLLDTLGDLRRYALLVEAEVRQRMGQSPEQVEQIIGSAN